MSPGDIFVGDSTAACRSKPAASCVIFTGIFKSVAFARRLIFTVIGRAIGHSPSATSTRAPGVSNAAQNRCLLLLSVKHPDLRQRERRVIDVRFHPKNEQSPGCTSGAP